MKYCIALLLTIAPYLVSAQKQGQPLIDSLLTALSNATEDTNKVNLLNRLAYTYSFVNPEEAIKHGQTALGLANKLHWEKGIGLALINSGIAYEAKPDHGVAIEYYQKAMAHYERMDDKMSVAKVLAYIAFVYVDQSNYPGALAADFKALSIYDSLGIRKSSAAMMENIGFVYFEQKEYTKTAEYYANALRINNDLGDKESIARNLGYSGILLEAQGDHAGAVQLYLKALKINQDLGKINYVQINLANIGNAYSQLKDYKNAMQYQVQALEISKNTGNKNTIAINLGNIGETYLRMAKEAAGRGKPEYLHNALQYLASAVGICKETNYSGPLIEFSQYLSESYSLSGNYKKAFESLEQYATTKDSVFSLQNKSQITSLEKEREDELRKKEMLIKDGQIKINELTISRNYYQQKLYIAGILLLLLVIGLAIRGLYLYRKSNSALLNEKKKHIQLIETQVNHLKKQTSVLNEISHLQAHEVRGAVATILGLVQLFNAADFSDHTNKVVIEGVALMTEKLDAAVKAVIAKGDSIDHADRINYSEVNVKTQAGHLSGEPDQGALI